MSTATATKKTGRKTTKKTLTATQKKRREEAKKQTEEFIKQANADIAKKVEGFAVKENWESFLNLTAQLHQYSYRNTIIAQSQHRGVKALAGFKKWQEHGRCVRKGEKAIRILAPFKVTVEVDKKDGDEGEKEKVSFIKYRTVPVFDISQTTIVDEEKANRVELIDGVTGTEGGELFDKLRSWLESEGWTVTDDVAYSSASLGWTSHKRKLIRIRPDMTPLAKAQVLAHEAAHAVLHSDLDGKNYVEHRGMWETEAESVAYIVCRAAGLTGGENAQIGYVANWSAQDGEILAKVAERVSATARTILHESGIVKG